MILYTSFCRIAAQACFACLLAAGAAAADREAFIVSGGFATPPYQFLDKNGSHSGYDVDLMKAAARVAGLEVQFEQEGPTASFTPDVLLAEAYPADNAEGVLQFCTPHSTHTHTVFVRDDALYRNLKDLRGRDVLATRRSPVYDWLKSHGFGENLVATQDVKSAIALLAAGNYEAVVCERHAGLRAIADGNLDNLRALDDSIFPVQYSFAVMREDKVLFDALESALTVLKNTGEDKKIRDKWLATPSKKRLALGGIYSYLVWLVVPALIILAAAIVSSMAIKKRTLARLRKLEHELAKARAENEQLAKEQAKQRYVINQLSTVSLVDQLSSVSRN